VTPAQAAYRAGAIVAELEARFGLTTGAVNNACTLPNRLPVVLRHVWAKGVGTPVVADLLDGFDPPDAVYAAEQGTFWIGYYHQKIARELPPDFPARLKSLREKAGLTVAALARSTGLSRAGLYKLESGESRPSWDVVQKIAAALSVPTDTFRDATPPS
jgi:DNA-binding XRE family transcriptional regulator